jgi:hypothetical protein
MRGAFRSRRAIPSPAPAPEVVIRPPCRRPERGQSTDNCASLDTGSRGRRHPRSSSPSPMDGARSPGPHRRGARRHRRKSPSASAVRPDDDGATRRDLRRRTSGITFGVADTIKVTVTRTIHRHRLAGASTRHQPDELVQPHRITDSVVPVRSSPRRSAARIAGVKSACM